MKTLVITFILFFSFSCTNLEKNSNLSSTEQSVQEVLDYIIAHGGKEDKYITVKTLDGLFEFDISPNSDRVSALMSHTFIGINYSKHAYPKSHFNLKISSLNFQSCLLKKIESVYDAFKIHLNALNFDYPYPWYFAARNDNAQVLYLALAKNLPVELFCKTPSFNSNASILNFSKVDGSIDYNYPIMFYLIQNNSLLIETLSFYNFDSKLLNQTYAGFSVTEFSLITGNYIAFKLLLDRGGIFDPNKIIPVAEFKLVNCMPGEQLKLVMKRIP